MRRMISIVAYGALALGLNGCFLYTTRDEGRELKRQVTLMNDRLVKIEDDAQKNSDNLSQMIEKAQVQVESMEDTLTRATRVLARNSADFGAEMDEVRNEMMSFKGALAEIRHEMEPLHNQIEEAQELARKANQQAREFALAAGLDLPADEEKVPEKRDAHFEMIEASFAAGRYGETRSLVQLYFRRYPDAKNLDEAQILIGKSYLAQKRYAKALGALRRFVDLYSRSRHMPEVLYEMAGAFYQLGSCDDAIVLLDTVISRYSESPFSSKSKQMKNTITQSDAKCDP